MKAAACVTVLFGLKGKRKCRLDEDDRLTRGAELQLVVARCSSLYDTSVTHGQRLAGSRLHFPVPGARFSLVPNTFRPREAICKNMNHSLYRVAISACFSNASSLETWCFTRYSTSANSRPAKFRGFRGTHTLCQQLPTFSLFCYIY